MKKVIEQKPYVRFFRSGLSNMDSLTATVVKRTPKGGWVEAYTCDGVKVIGFTPVWAHIGAQLLVTPRKMFKDGKYLFICESIAWPEAQTAAIIERPSSPPCTAMEIADTASVSAYVA